MPPSQKGGAEFQGRGILDSAGGLGAVIREGTRVLAVFRVLGGVPFGPWVPSLKYRLKGVKTI